MKSIFLSLRNGRRRQIYLILNSFSIMYLVLLFTFPSTSCTVTSDLKKYSTIRPSLESTVAPKPSSGDKTDVLIWHFSRISRRKIRSVSWFICFSFPVTRGVLIILQLIITYYFVNFKINLTYKIKILQIQINFILPAASAKIV